MQKIKRKEDKLKDLSKDYFLSCNFKESGNNNENELREAINYLEKHTAQRQYQPYMLNVLSFRHMVREANLQFFIFYPDELGIDSLRSGENNYFDGRLAETHEMNIHREAFNAMGFDESNLNELADVGFAFVVKSGETDGFPDDDSLNLMFVSQAMVTSLCSSLNIGRLSRGFNEYRDMYLAKSLSDKSVDSGKDGINIITRFSDHGGERGFFCYRSRYAYIPQTVVLDIMDEMKNDGYRLRSWAMDHEMTTVFLKKDAEDGLPPMGLIIKTSSTGEAGVSIEAIMYAGENAYMSVEKVSRSHSGNFVTEDLLRDYKNNCVPESERVCKRLRAMKERKTDDLKKTVQKLINTSEFWETLGGKRSARAKASNPLPSGTGTYYDAFKYMMDVSDSVSDAPEYLREKISKSLKKAIGGGK